MLWLWVALGASVPVVVILALSWSSLRKWFGTTVGGQRVKFRDLLGMSSFELQEVLRRSIAEDNYTAASWIVEVWLRRYGPGTLRPLLEEELRRSMADSHYFAAHWAVEVLLRRYPAHTLWGLLEEVLHWSIRENDAN